jgi:cytochrome b involved in lipid metabolism
MSSSNHLSPFKIPAVPQRKPYPVSPFEWDKLDIPPTAPQRIPLSELEKHATEDDCWIAIQGKVYDITRYISLCWFLIFRVSSRGAGTNPSRQRS